MARRANLRPTFRAFYQPYTHIYSSVPRIYNLLFSTVTLYAASLNTHLEPDVTATRGLSKDGLMDRMKMFWAM
jgi:hypothetical protein